MRLLWSLLIALAPLRTWAGPVVRYAAPSFGPSSPLACPACGLSGLTLRAGGGATLIPAGSLGAAVLSAPVPLPQVPVVSATPAPRAGLQSLSSVEISAERLAAAQGDGAKGQALADLFDHSAAGDGAPVYPQLATPETMSHDREAVAVKAELRRAVAAAQPALERSVWHGGWRGPGTTLHDPCCGDAAPKLGLLLRQMGHAADVVEAEAHYYVLYRLPFGEVVIDPTIRQFFGGARAPPDIPKVFVGTVADLNALFTRHEAAKTTSFDVPRLYFRDAQVRNGKIDEVRRLAQASPHSPEYEPLLTASRPPPAELPTTLVLSVR
ncbi:MAG: hypothetical protein NTY77_06090 [Elusimicrobia bacterium]|nr:hypothetical protein [Elusimicrobiota bacterium]